LNVTAFSALRLRQGKLANLPGPGKCVRAGRKN
jgi:hypothetical protein